MHIGANKSASSTLQNYWNSQIAELKNQKIYYPKDHNISLFYSSGNGDIFERLANSKKLSIFLKYLKLKAN